MDFNREKTCQKVLAAKFKEKDDQTIFEKLVKAGCPREELRERLLNVRKLRLPPGFPTELAWLENPKFLTDKAFIDENRRHANKTKAVAERLRKLGVGEFANQGAQFADNLALAVEAWEAQRMAARRKARKTAYCYGLYLDLVEWVKVQTHHCYYVELAQLIEIIEEARGERNAADKPFSARTLRERCDGERAARQARIMHLTGRKRRKRQKPFFRWAP